MGATVLIVDDSPTMRSALRLYLRELNVEVAEAENGTRALQLARLLKPAVAIVDLQLADEDGVHLAQRLRDQQPPVEAPLPVLLLTGESSGEWMQRATEARVDGVLHKPVSATVLRARVEELLGGAA